MMVCYVLRCSSVHVFVGYICYTAHECGLCFIVVLLLIVGCLLFVFMSVVVLLHIYIYILY